MKASYGDNRAKSQSVNSPASTQRALTRTGVTLPAAERVKQKMTKANVQSNILSPR